MNIEEDIINLSKTIDEISFWEIIRSKIFNKDLFEKIKRRLTYLHEMAKYRERKKVRRRTENLSKQTPGPPFTFRIGATNRPRHRLSISIKCQWKKVQSYRFTSITSRNALSNAAETVLIPLTPLYRESTRNAKLNTHY